MAPGLYSPGSAAKRGFDVLLALSGLLLLSPMLVGCMVLIRSTSPGPALFRQPRVGRGGRVFRCLKLRTMHLDTEHLPTHELGSSAVTRVGSFLRRSKLDELPQLWNVLKGEMSLVGPRPCLPSQTELIEARRRLALLELRPGITGVSQVAGVDMSDPQRLAVLDATYLDCVSLATDIRLIAATLLGRVAWGAVAREE